MGRVWLRVALAAGAGLASLVVCSAVLVAILLLLSHAAMWWSSIFGSPSYPSLIFWVGLVILIIVAAAGLSLPALALGARGGHLTKPVVLSVLGFCAFMVLALTTPFIPPEVPLTLMAMVATPLIGSLFAIREDYRYTVGLVRATVIGAGAIYCASLLATLLTIWLSRVEPGWHFLFLVPLIVASSSWVVLPAIVAALRPD